MLVSLSSHILLLYLSTRLSTHKVVPRILAKALLEVSLCRIVLASSSSAPVPSVASMTSAVSSMSVGAMTTTTAASTTTVVFGRGWRSLLSSAHALNNRVQKRGDGWKRGRRKCASCVFSSGHPGRARRLSRRQAPWSRFAQLPLRFLLSGRRNRGSGREECQRRSQTKCRRRGATPARLPPLWWGRQQPH